MALKLSLRPKQFLIALHVIGAMGWFGGTVCMLLLGAYLKGAENGEQLYYTLANMHLVDESLLKFPAVLTLVTGVLLSVWTHWGLARYYWIVIKLILTVVTLLSGIFFLNDWLTSLLDLAKEMGFAAKDYAGFQSNLMFLTMMAVFHLICLVIMTFVTYFKPFGKIRKTPSGVLRG